MNDFAATIVDTFTDGLRNTETEIFQVNLGRLCNLSCAHCHLDCSPLRTEVMTRSTMERIVGIVGDGDFRLVDLTGGAPEIHPRFRPFVDALCGTGSNVQVRTNFTALLEPGQDGTTEFLRERRVRLVGSMPCYLQENVDTQRGDGTYELSVAAIRRLNGLGYGVAGGVELDLIYNPGGAFLPGDQAELEAAYKDELGKRFGISFDRLAVITNMPIGRFGRELTEKGQADAYMGELRQAFNRATLEGLMCRHQVCVDWDGTMYDCDFNIALGMELNHGAPNRIEDYARSALHGRRIVTGNHCFACTAGAGSSCGGVLV